MPKRPTVVVTEDPSVYSAADPDGVFTALLAPYPPIMSLDMVGEFLGCDRKTVAGYCRSGFIPQVPMPPEGTRINWIIPKICLIKMLVGNPATPSEKEARNGQTAH